MIQIKFDYLGCEVAKNLEMFDPSGVNNISIISNIWRLYTIASLCGS